MTIHLVYPHDKARSTSAPWSIGYNLAKGLRKRGHIVRCFDWDEELCIFPDSPDDILIGHPHPEPGKCFRTSMVAPWKMVVSIAPWNGSDQYRADQEYVWERVDHHLLICGEKWYLDFPDDAYANYFSYRGLARLDMAIDPIHFPNLKQTYNEPGARGFLYIGCAVDLKGTAYLEELIKKSPGLEIGHIGNGTIKGAQSYGYMDLQSDEAKIILSQYDFLIMPGIHDANPTTVLEAMCWGLIPVLSEGCGYGPDDYHGYQLARSCNEDIPLIESLQRANKTMLETKAAQNRDLVKSRYTWQRFINSVALVLEASDETPETQLPTPEAP